MALADRIAELERILDAGGESVTTDGLTVKWDLGEVRKRLAELRREDVPDKRPRVATIDLSGF
jgi:hypothetical protein